MKTVAWAYWLICELAAAAFFWLPLWWWRAPPIGLTVVLVLCLLRAWKWPYAASIKPIYAAPYPRVSIDGWIWPFNTLWGNPEDGVSGMEAFGPGWTGRYNPTANRWLAVCWNCRNWLVGFNYITWPWAAAAPNLQLPYTVPAWVPRIGGTSRILRLGWQQLPASDGWVGLYRVRMVCSP